jgi:ethanolamine utilization protein EutA
LIAMDTDNRLLRLDESARIAADRLGVKLVLGAVVSPADLTRLVNVLAEVILGYVRRDSPDELAKAMLLTESLSGPPPEVIMFSGGVAEFIYEREQATYGDIGKAIAQYVRQRIDSLGLRLEDSGQGIRATAIGASQFTVQVSGKTAYLGIVSLPLYNVPVIVPQTSFAGKISPAEVAEAIAVARGQLDGVDVRATIAIGLRFSGSPEHARLHALAEGIAMAFADAGDAPLVLMLDRDIGRSLGRMLDGQFGLRRKVICLDGVELKNFEYVDVGAPVEPTNVVPIVVKSLLFGRG